MVLDPAPPWEFAASSIFSRSIFQVRAVIRLAAYVRNLNVESFSKVYFVVSDGRREIGFWEDMPSTTSYVDRQISMSKSATKDLLAAAGLQVPQGKVFGRSNIDSARAFAEQIGYPVVVKPVAGSHGTGVTPGITSENELRLAWLDATQAYAGVSVIVEKHIDGRDHRLYVVGDRLVAATLREPAYVDGDGENSVADLVASKNLARRVNPYLARRPLRLTPTVLRNLQAIGLSPESVPERGRRVQLQSIANIAGGGENVDVTERVHPEFAGIAVQTRQVLSGTVNGGIDLLAEDIAAPPGGQQWAITEVNTSPAIAMHHFPVTGTGRDVAGELIGHLFPESRVVPPSEYRRVRAGVAVEAGRTDLRTWIWQRANLRGLRGWVRKRAVGGTEAVFCGAPNAVESMIDVCRAGPRDAVVTGLSVESCQEPVPPSFTIRWEEDGGRTVSTSG